MQYGSLLPWQPLRVGREASSWKAHAMHRAKMMPDAGARPSAIQSDSLTLENWNTSTNKIKCHYLYISICYFIKSLESL